jgi:predicted nuclease of restriction endonuclease-like (RecB) superfamily
MTAARRSGSLYARIRGILESARSTVARSVNTTQVVANWLIGQEIVEEEQRGEDRANYGEQLLTNLSRRLRKDLGGGFSVSALKYIRAFYLSYPSLLKKQYAMHVELPMLESKSNEIRREARGLLPGSAVPPGKSHAARGQLGFANISDPAYRESWRPGQLHASFSWTHYRTLLRVENQESRSFYEIETIKNGWSARELERQINSLLYERLALSKDKKGLLRLAKKGHEVQKPTDLFKDPMVMEFLGLPQSPKLVESDLEEALIENLRAFLLEMGRGFAFVARQERITIDGDHFYIDLVFYHTILKCFVLIDLKVGKLTHQDLGQLQLYVNYYDNERRSAGDHPTLGLILCTDKNEAVVRYTLGKRYRKNVFASRYQLHVPTEAQLKAELRRELRRLQRPQGRGEDDVCRGVPAQ